MAATVRGTFELIDRASSTLRSIERQALKTQAAVVGVGAALDKQEAQSKRGTGALEGQSRALRSFEKDLKGARTETTSLTRSHDQLTTSQGRAARSMSTFSRTARTARQDFAALRKEHQSLARELKGAAGGAVLGGMLLGPLGGVAGAAAGAVAGRVGGGFMQFVQQKQNMKTLKGAVDDVSSAFSGLGSALGALKVPAVVSSIAPLIASVDALGGGLIALLPKLADAAQGFLAIPTGVSVAVQGFSALKLAFSGVSQALQAGMQMQQQWSLNQQQFQQQVTQASDGVVEAQLRLTNAIYAQQQAQLQLTVTRRDATRQLQDMEFEAKDAVLKEARAGLNIQQARLELQQALATPGTTQLQLESDRLAVLEAQASAQQTHTQAVRSRVDYSRALRKDPTSEPVMKVAQAQHQAAISVTEIAQAERGLQRAQYQLNFLMSQGNAGAAAYKKALNALSPAAQAFVKFLVGPIGPGSSKSMLQQLQSLQGAAAGGLFPPLISGVKALLGVWSTLEKVMGDTGRSIGTTLAGVMKVFADPHWLLNVGEGNVKILDTVGQGFVALAGALKSLILAGQPFVLWLAQLFRGWAKQKAAADSSAAGMDRLRARFDRAKAAIKEVVGVLRNIWDAFKNVLNAARPLGDWLWGRAGQNTGNWKQWTATHGKAMTDYFNNLKPTLSAIARLFHAIGKAFIGLGDKQGQQGATGLADTLTKLVPVLASMLSSASSFLPIIADIFSKFAVIMEKLLGAVSWLLRKVPALGWLIASAFTVGVVTRFMGKMTGGITSLIGLWGKYKLAQTTALASGAGPGEAAGRGLRGMFSPGTTGAAAALTNSRTWGILSAGGPGSVENPLMVRVEGAGGSLLNPAGKDSPVGSIGKDATAAERDAAVAQDAASADKLAAGGGAGLLDLSKGAGLASKVAPEAGLLAKLGGVGGGITKALGPAGAVLKGAGAVLGKIAVPLAVITTAIPAVLAFINTHGSFGTKAQAAGNAAVSSLTFGLAPHVFGVSAAFQKAQGTRRGATTFQQMFSGGRNIDPSTGGMSAAGVTAFNQRIATLQSQIATARRGTQVIGGVDPRTGRPTMVSSGPDIRVIQDRQAQIATLEKAFNRQQWQAGAQAGTNWQNAYTQGISNGKPPQQAMGSLLKGLTMQLGQLNPMGRRSLQNSMVAWAFQMQQSGKMSKAQVQQLNSYIVAQFQAMGKNVTIVNGQILDGSAQQWNQIATAITNPALQMQAKLAGVWNQIRAEALGELGAMGFTPTQSKNLFSQLTKGNLSTTVLKQAQTGAGGQHVTPQGTITTSGAQATGGRIAGSDMHDVYGLGPHIVGGGELIVNRHQEMQANAALMRAGAPTLGSIVSNVATPHWVPPSRRQGARGRTYGGYVSPFGGPVTAERIDQGVDYSMAPGTALRAIGPGRILGISPDWYAGQPFLDYQITGGPLSGVDIYYAEQIAPKVTSGSFAAGTTLATFAASGTGLEAGFGTGTPGTTLAQITGGYNEGQLTAAGQAFSNLMVQLGEPAGLAEGRSVVGNMKALGLPSIAGIVAGKGGAGGAGQIPPLKAPKIKGVGGVPLAVGQSISDAWAKGMTEQVNKKLASMAPAGGAISAAGFSGGGSAAANKILGHKMMLHAGWGEDQWPALLALWMGESGWSDTAMNNPSMGWLAAGNASGIPQSDGNGQVYRSGDAAGQIAWGLNYIRGRYGSPSVAYNDWLGRSPHWYAEGGRVPQNAGWFKHGGSFVTNGPTVFGAGEGGQRERVTVEPAGKSSRPIQVQIDKIEVHRKGDVQRIVDEELRLLAQSFERDA